MTYLLEVYQACGGWAHDLGEFRWALQDHVFEDVGILEADESR